MSKQTWVNIGGAYKKVTNVWVNVDGLWKSSVIPKGYISGAWKEFMQYITYVYNYGTENPAYPLVFDGVNRGPDYLYSPSGIDSVGTDPFDVSGISKIGIVMKGYMNPGGTMEFGLKSEGTSLIYYSPFTVLKTIDGPVSNGTYVHEIDVSSVSGSYFIAINFHYTNSYMNVYQIYLK